MYCTFQMFILLFQVKRPNEGENRISCFTLFLEVSRIVRLRTVLLSWYSCQPRQQRPSLPQENSTWNIDYGLKTICCRRMNITSIPKCVGLAQVTVKTTIFRSLNNFYLGFDLKLLLNRRSSSIKVLHGIFAWIVY